MEKSIVSQEFTCKCGRQKGWVTEGETMKWLCPICGRIYRGVYSPKTFQIDAVQVECIRKP